MTITTEKTQKGKMHMKVKEFLYGGDYNPEQWPEEVWEADMKLFKKAHINELTLNVFSWATLQPSEDEYDFSKLDKIMDLVRANGFKVMLATSTAATPPWMAKRHPDILRTDGKKLVRLLYRYAQRGGRVEERLLDFANLVSGYFFMLALWMNHEDGFEEIPFESRNYLK